MRDPIVGIDLGTSNSVVSHADASGRVHVLADSAGYRLHPSVVSFHPNGGVVIGAPAKQRKVIDPKNTIYSIKRLIGRRFDSREVQEARQRAPFEIKAGANLEPRIVTRAGDYAPEEISAIVLDHMRLVAASALETEVNRAVVTVPAAFNDAQRSATATAGAIAKLSVVRVLNEPTAAALAYGHTRQLHETIAVYDFGGGTFDVTILRLDDEVYEVLGTAGNTFLGGDDLDERLVERMAAKFLAEQRVDLRTDELAMMRLRAVAEQTKIELSRRARAVVRVDEVAYATNGKPLNLEIEITRDELVRMIADIVQQTFPVCQEALALAQIDARAIDDVILVGGTTRIPYVRDEVTKFFGRAPRTDVNPEDAVALGAGLQAKAIAEPVRVSSVDTTEIGGGDTHAETLVAGIDGLGGLSVATLPAGQRFDAYPEELELEPAPAPKPRPRLRTESGPGARPVERGQAVDSLDIELDIEPAATTPIARMTREPASHKTMIGAVVARPPASPQTPPRPPASPSAAPQMRTMIAEAPPSAPPQTRTRIAQAPIELPQAPTMIAPAPPRPAAQAPTMIAPVPTPAVQAPTMIAPARTPVIIDVTPRGLGIGTVAGFCEELIQRNARLPAERRKVFTTVRDRQDSVRIVVVQGESRRLGENVVLGDLTLSELTPRPRGETAIEVTFALDAGGILHVRARDTYSGREQRASLSLAGALPESAVDASRDRLSALRR